MRRRIEVFSPKLGRRLNLGSHEVWQLWPALEANPRGLSFCERPALLDAEHPITIGFWVELAAPPTAEFRLLEHESDESDGPDGCGLAHDKPALASRAHGLPVRQILRSQSGTWRRNGCRSRYSC
ncbi:MAG: hypothetical protein KGL43_28550 [Burkholderiales bacterium]|nr:hypothetical protein [Burkholderiales bacterium]MDE2397305.1 hypothetical protein [Burkholderiales bacterium]MDE2457561.1 hypothetical protein [Burkholderiales bacterium]